MDNGPWNDFCKYKDNFGSVKIVYNAKRAARLNFVERIFSMVKKNFRGYRYCDADESMDRRVLHSILHTEKENIKKMSLWYLKDLQKIYEENKMK